MSPRSPRPALPGWPVWMLLVSLAVAGLAWWWLAGRPVDMPDAPSSRVACVSYAPFRRPGETPYDLDAFVSPTRIDADLRALSQRFDCVRTYSQGQGLSVVPEVARRYGMKVILGIWLGRDAATNEAQLRMGVAVGKAYPDVLRMVIVGNEVLLRQDLTPAELMAYVSRARALIPRQVPVSYADVWENWLRYPQVARAVDELTIHILPYWEDRPVPPQNAVAHVASVYARMRREFAGKPVMIGETGWPSYGKPRWAARATVVNEARYLRGFLDYASRVAMPYNVIEAFDQPWKRRQEGTVGGYWGIFDVHARPKFPLTGPVVEIAHWWWGWWAALAGAAVVAGAGLLRARPRTPRPLVALILAGIAAGTALAWQLRQMAYACRNVMEWSVSIAAVVCALASALALARLIARRLDDDEASSSPRWLAPLRSGWLLVAAWLDVLLAIDGRYRDFPLGLLALPAVGVAVLAWLRRADDPPRLPGDRPLAAVMLVGAVAIVVQERGLSVAAWLWLVLNLCLALPVLAWRRLPAQQQHAA